MAAPFAKAIYNSKTWKTCRDAYFSYANGLCERCGAPGDEVHHKKALTPQNINDAQIVFGWDNLELLCRDCHIMEHEKKKNLRRGRPIGESEKRVRFDEEGNPKPVDAVVIVWGAPFSGKATYIAEHMQHMDAIVDMDRILECFAGIQNMEDDAQRVADYLPFTMAVRDAVYKLVKDGGKGIGTTWIAAGLPKRQDRELMRVRFPRARLVHIDEDVQTCMERAAIDEKRTDKAQAREAITKYFRDYEPER